MAPQIVVRTLAGACALALSGTLTWSGPPAHSATSGKEVNLTFEQANLRNNAGNAAVTVKVVTHNGGSVQDAAGPSGGKAAAFPAFKTSSAPQAMMTLVDDSGVDDLSPGTAAFRFGADFRLDERSTGSSTDNGNNLIQRGLAGAAMQYKLQVDGDRPMCRIKGSGGVVSVSSSRLVEPGVWYRATCSRDGGDVTLVVIRLSDDKRWTYTGSGRTGTLDAASRSTPLSIGGKVGTSGAIRTDDSDQFNGLVDDAFLNVF